jgi:cell division protein FtsW
MPNFNSIYKFYYEWWKNIDKTLFLLIIFLFSLGLFFSLVSTSLIASDKLDTNNYFFFFKHFAYILIGVVVLIFFSSLSKENLFKISFYFFFISLFLLFLVPVLGTEVKGSKRWLNLFFFTKVPTNRNS